MSTWRWATATADQRWAVVEDNVRRMVRTGAQFVIGAVLSSDLGPINAFDLDYVTIAGSFVGGCVVWLFTTLAAPPVHTDGGVE